MPTTKPNQTKLETGFKVVSSDKLKTFDEQYSATYGLQAFMSTCRCNAPCSLGCKAVYEFQMKTHVSSSKGTLPSLDDMNHRIPLADSRVEIKELEARSHNLEARYNQE
eukprot:1154770-Pelagomonas_calceolata.AAC.3